MKRTCVTEGCTGEVGRHGALGRCPRCYRDYRIVNAPQYPCEVDECGKPILARGMCSKHYQRWKDTGSVGSDAVRACGGCGGQFKPNRAYQIWCSNRCAARNSARHRLKVKTVLPLDRGCWWCQETFRDPDFRKKSCSEACRRNLASLRDIYSKYGITKDQYRALYFEQEGKCAICEKPERSERNRLLCVDHDHETGHIKGLLCSHCNRGIGLFGDNVRTIRRAAEYVARTRQLRLMVA